MKRAAACARCGFPRHDGPLYLNTVGPRDVVCFGYVARAPWWFRVLARLMP